MWHQSGDFFFEKSEKSRKKSKKWRFLGSKKKGRSLGILYHPRKTRKIVFFDLLIAPLAGTFQKPDPLPRSCFYTVLVLVVGGVQSGDNFFRLFFQGPSCRRQICAIDFRRWYNTRGGVKNPEFRAFPRNADPRLTPIWRAATWSIRGKTHFIRGPKIAFYRTCFIFGPLIGAATHERHSVDNR